MLIDHWAGRIVRWVILLGCVNVTALQACGDDQPPAAQAAQPAGDRYALPQDADVARLLEFIDSLEKYEPATAEDFLNHRSKSPAALKAAAGKILQLDKDPASAAVQKAKSILLQAKVSELISADPPMRRQIYEELAAQLAAAGNQLGREEAILAINAARNLEASGDTALSIEAYNKFGELFAQSETPVVAEFSKVLLGTARRLDLVGKPFSLAGTAFDGTAFDLSQLKGKVVLVDFWATWCGPCLAEYPNIKRNYDAYAAKGFDVVGVTVKQDRADLQRYLAEKKIPWTTLHDPEDHPALIEYGISSIPTMFLIGKDGKVLSTTARGEELDRLLIEQLGVPDSTTDPAAVPPGAAKP